jgi:3',5'-cyclic AMP phosphodiesterase CpdA
MHLGRVCRVTRLLATSDLHVNYPENRAIVEHLRPTSDTDWLIVAGDIGDRSADIEWTLSTLRQHFAKVIWSPGNHELWTTTEDPVEARGEARYQHLVDLCRRLDVLTPEDDYPIWDGPGGPAIVASLFLLYDYTFRVDGVATKEAALAKAYDAGVVCTDEYFLHPDPYPSRETWCDARVAATRARLDACDPDLPTVLITHWPLVREPTRILRYPDFALWCGTEQTADWHLRYRTTVAVYGHLHIPRTTKYDGVRFEEVSLGYPREWQKRERPPVVPRVILS